MRLVLSLLAIPVLVGAQTPDSTRRPLPESRAVRANGPIRLDGKLDDPAWAAAPVTSQFTQINPNVGTPASQRTEVRVVYDDEALYVGVRLHDDGPVTARLGRRDMNLGDSDWFGVMIDSYHDHRTAFGFDVNPAGVRRDEVKTINDDDNSWDAVWDVATSIDAGGWTAEYRIPFSQLRFSRDSAQTWGIQFERVIGRTHAYEVSTFIPKRDVGGVPAYGHLVGLTKLTPGKRIELLPYSVARAEYIDRRFNPYRGRHEYGSSAGLDLKYRVASNLTLNGTINPDFGQVELDPAVVNLGVYETFFEEKRPFFLEGSEIFDFGLGNTSGGQLFYSRRIGRTPTLRAPTIRADVPPATSILGAGKLSGKVGGWSIGTLGAVTGREEARYLDASNVDRRWVAEPRSAYFVGRARRELRAGRSIVGGVVTAVHRSLDSDVLEASFRRSALATGVDFRHESNDRSWLLRGDAEMSRIAGTPASIVAVQRASNHFFQRPDASHLGVDTLATSLFGYSVSTTLAKQSGEHWRGEVAGALTSPGYEVNDLGFAVRTDRQDVEGVLTYLENRPGALRRWSVNGVVRSEHNYAHEPIQTATSVSANAQTLGYWNFSLFLRRGYRAIDDRLTRGGPVALRPAVNGVSIGMSSDGRLPVTGDLHAAAERSESGAWNWFATTGVGVRSASRWTLRVAPVFSRSFSPAQYVQTVSDAANIATYGRRYIFAPLSQTEVGLETRMNFTLTPTLSFESYVQPLISSADYGAPIQLVAPRTYDFAPYAGQVADLDFNLRSLRGNAVLRWEWRPGSTLYVAWQQTRENVGEVGNFAFDRDRGALMATRPDNIVLVKLNYWFVP
jgi:hypothetical protein